MLHKYGKYLREHTEWRPSVAQDGLILNALYRSFFFYNKIVEYRVYEKLKSEVAL